MMSLLEGSSMSLIGVELNTPPPSDLTPVLGPQGQYTDAGFCPATTFILHFTEDPNMFRFQLTLTS